MKLPASDAVASFGKKPKIRKGYYPAQLLNIKEKVDAEGNPKEDQFGRQLVFEFAVFKPDENGKPTEPMKWKDQENNKEIEVVIPAFLYHLYKEKDKDGYRTAVTKNAKITKAFIALGWEWNAEKGVEDTDEFIGNWVELNIDDYEQNDGEGGTYKASGIIKISNYEGPKPDVSSELLGAQKEPKKVTKQVKHQETVNTDKEEKQKKLKEMLDNGTLTENGYNDALEQLETAS